MSTYLQLNKLIDSSITSMMEVFFNGRLYKTNTISYNTNIISFHEKERTKSEIIKNRYNLSA